MSSDYIRPKLEPSTWNRLKEHQQAPAESIDEVINRVLDKVDERPELAADGGTSSPFPVPGSGERVAYDKSGSGPGNVTGHSTVHLLDEDGARPLCETEGGVESIPIHIKVAPRVDFAVEIDDCADCVKAAR